MDFYRVARSGQVPDGTVRRFFVNEVELAVARWEGDVYITSNYCTHLDCLLSSGHVTDDGLLCSCHGSVFSTWPGSHHARRAWSTPKCMLSSSRRLCASVLTTIFTPSSRARNAWTSERSSRFGLALTFCPLRTPPSLKSMISGISPLLRSSAAIRAP